MGGGDCGGFPNFNIAIFYLAKQNKNKTKQKKLSRMKVKEKPIQTNRSWGISPLTYLNYKEC